MHNELQLRRSSDINRSLSTFPDAQSLTPNSSMSSSIPASHPGPIGTHGLLDGPKGSRQWLNIGQEDGSRIYALGVVTFNHQTVVELFQQYVSLWLLESGG